MVKTDKIINYPDHIQPLWTRPRGAAGVNTCTNCHADSAKLDLRATVSGTGRLVSYEELLVGDPVIDPATGLPVTRIEEGVQTVVRGPALVETMSSNAMGMARSSRLAEIMFGESLKASADARTVHPNPPTTGANPPPNHAALLNKAELRLISEWMDLGGQYYNNPFDGGVQKVMTLNEATFAAQVLPVLRTSCMAGCHLAIGDKTTAAGTSFRQNRFVLTGESEGDFGATLSMISDTCTPASNYLLKRPSTVPHPSGAASQASAVLPVGSAGYTAISNWIRGGCPSP